MIMSSLPFLLALGALLLFAVGYAAHNLWGDNNPLEEVAEELLNKQYNIDVEFSSGKIKSIEEVSND
jgi:hypothetical protein